MLTSGRDSTPATALCSALMAVVGVVGVAASAIVFADGYKTRFGAEGLNESSVETLWALAVGALWSLALLAVMREVVLKLGAIEGALRAREAVDRKTSPYLATFLALAACVPLALALGAMGVNVYMKPTKPTAYYIPKGTWSVADLRWGTWRTTSKDCHWYLTSANGDGDADGETSMVDITSDYETIETSCALENADN